MTNEIFANADRIADLLRSRGEYVLHVSRSENRFGEYSAYIDCGSIPYRVSDHSCNSDFRVGEIDVPVNADNAYFDVLAANKKAAQNRAQKAKEIAAAELLEKDLPFIVRYNAATENKKQIIIEAYPNAAHNNRQQKEIAARWKACKIEGTI